MSISISNILNSHDINELKALGSYLEVKRTIEHQLSVELKVRSWESLFNKFSNLRNKVSSNKESILNLISAFPLKDAEKQIETIIGVRFITSDKKQLSRHFSLLFDALIKTEFDPSKRFEETKHRNFQHSSRLEGINISIVTNTSLESVLAKYQR